MQDMSDTKITPPALELTRDMIEHLPSDLHKAIAQDYISRGYWRLLE